MAGETAVEGAVVVNATPTSTREMVASHGTIKTHGTAHTAEVEIMGDGDIINLRAIPTLPRPKPTAIRTEGTHPKVIIRTNNRAGIEDHLSRRMTHGLRIHNHPTEVVEEGIIQDTMARTGVELMGTVEGEAALLRIEEARRMVVAGMEVREGREGDTDMEIKAVDTINPRMAAVAAEVIIVEEAVIILAEAINPAGPTALASSLTGTEDTTRGVEVVGGGTDHADAHTIIPLRLASFVFSSCFESTFVSFGDILIVFVSIYYVARHSV